MDNNESKDEQASKKRKLSLSLSRRRRFNATSKEEIEAMSTPLVAKNTSTCTRWAVKKFTGWFNDYNTRNEAKPCPDAVLTPTCSAEVLNEWIRVFVTKTRTHNGENYPPRTLYSLLTGVLRHMRAQNPSYPNFMD